MVVLYLCVYCGKNEGDLGDLQDYDGEIDDSSDFYDNKCFLTHLGSMVSTTTSGLINARWFLDAKTLVNVSREVKLGFFKGECFGRCFPG